MDAPTLTARQQEVLDCIRRHIGEYGVAPTVRELCAEFGWRSPNAANCHLRVLVAKGHIEIWSKCARGIRVLGSPCPACGK